MLRYSKEFSIDILKSFECGILALDDFIHCSLASFLKEDSRYTFHLVTDEERGIVALVITSTGIFVDRDGEYDILPAGKPWGYLDEGILCLTGVFGCLRHLTYGKTGVTSF